MPERPVWHALGSLIAVALGPKLTVPARWIPQFTRES